MLTSFLFQPKTTAKFFLFFSTKIMLLRFTYVVDPRDCSKNRMTLFELAGQL